MTFTLLLLLTACGGEEGPRGAGEEATEANAEVDDNSPTGSGPTDDGEQITVRYATPLPETLTFSEGVMWWADQVEERTNGRVAVEMYFGGTLYGAADMLPALGDGRVEAAYLADAYNPAEFPIWSMTGLPFRGDNAEAGVYAWQDFYESQELYRSEFERQNVVPLFFHPVNPAATLTSEPVETLDDFSGLRLRAVGRVAEGFSVVGAETVAIDPAEIYESLQRGVIDGVGIQAFEVGPVLGLDEVAPHVVDTGIGLYGSAGLFFNRDFWDELPNDVKTIMEEVAAEHTESVGMEILEEHNARACDAYLEGGGSISMLSEDEISQWAGREGIEDIETEWAEEVEQSANLETGVALDLLAEWQDLYASRLEDAEYVNPAETCAADQ